MSLKYRTSAGTSASDFTDLVVKVGDTLPIGAIIGFDTTGTIPNGWEYYAENQIKKISPTTPANGNIENQYGTSQTNAYSEEYANNTFANKNIENYSTSETKIGTWIDGKPLYRKVISFALQNSSVHLIQHNISNVDIIFIKDFFGWKPSSGISRTLDYTYNTDTNYAQVNRTVFQYLITNKQDPGDAIGYAILEYTKTTD